MPWRDVCTYLRDVASSLGLLHSRRLIHRDVTVGNIRLTGEGRAKLLDFGSAKLLAGAEVTRSRFNMITFA